ncbi:primosomal protein N', partial [Asaia sp. SF2.1]
YFEAIAACLADSRQCLVLLPEIALSTQWTDRFARRFGVQPALWHSELGGKKRRETWHAIAKGQAPVVVGARSALFLPFPDLGLIVVDEEHETAFKQEEGVTYHGRDMAIVRARLSDVPAILVSATPSLETLTNVEHGRYQHVVLHSRHGNATLPDVRLVDMRRAPPERGQFLSPALTDAISATFAHEEQAMLFLNRRGYAPLTLCRACGHRMECPNCSAWLVEHRARQILTCHHCGHHEPLPDTCPSCAAESSLVAVGPGIERVHEEARLHFPDARILVMASDTLGSPSATADAVRRISDREIDLVIGTQIVAKGWHFPDLTLVGVVDADLGLGGGDLRAAERTVQLLHQVAGRAGRAEKPGTVLLQSYLGDHPVMKALVSNDYLAFMEQESAQRKPGFWPPYGRLAAVIVSADSAEAADKVANLLGARAPEGAGIQVLGPAPAPLAILRGRHRRRLLLRTRRNVAVQPILRAWLDGVKLTSHERIDIDIDPISFL